MRYLAIRRLNHTMYSEVTQAQRKIITLPHRCECACADAAPDSTTATAPAIPSTSPATLSFVKRSIPSATDSASTKNSNFHKNFSFL